MKTVLYSDPAIDLMTKMLVFNPEQRITVVEALNHPLLAKLHLEDDEVLFLHPALQRARLSS